MAGGAAFSLWTAWHYGGEDPYRLFNMLDADYMPNWRTELDRGDLEPERPRFPDRVRRFMYGLGRASAIIEGRMEDPMPFRRSSPVRDGRPEVEGKGVPVLLDRFGRPMTSEA